MEKSERIAKLLQEGADAMAVVWSCVGQIEKLTGSDEIRDFLFSVLEDCAGESVSEETVDEVMLY